MLSQKPWQDKQLYPPEAAEMYYLIGMCQIEERDYLNAHDAFNNAIKVKAKYPEAYYQRGLVKLRLNQSKGKNWTSIKIGKLSLNQSKITLSINQKR